MIQLTADDGGIGHIAELQDLKRRIEALPKPATGDSKAARILFDNGAVAYEGGLLADAARYYADARKKDPSDVEIVANLGFTYIKLGNLKAAIEPLTAAVTLAPGRSARWTNLAEYYARNGQSREAAACYALAVHFSRNPAKTVEFIGELAQNPDPKVQQAAQRALQLSFVQSINAQAKATLESPLAEAQPASRAVPQPTPQPAPLAALPEEPARATAQPPNPATVLDEPTPANKPTPTPTPAPNYTMKLDSPPAPGPAMAGPLEQEKLQFENDTWCAIVAGRAFACEIPEAQELLAACVRRAQSHGRHKLEIAEISGRMRNAIMSQKYERVHLGMGTGPIDDWCHTQVEQEVNTELTNVAGY
ncbi:MAG: tetratricopeptide repeat protein [Candidatus Competibacter sp.]